MTAVTDDVLIEGAAPPDPALRWLLAIAGVVWLLVALVVLSFTPASVGTIGVMMGAVIVLFGVDELVAATQAVSWRWLHLIAAAVFIVIGVLSMLEPFQTFGVLALFVGWYLVAKGFFDVFLAIGSARPLWGLALAVGIAEILLGLWALGYPGRSAWLLILWVGTGALFRGIGDLVAAFAGDWRR